jgi:aryl-alcohol dehydrogenase-like predicted oxidoreductase
MMKVNKLGSTDLVVSHLACGGLFVSSFGAEFEEGKKAVRRALERGINYVDTAPGYANSEEVLGQFLEGVSQPYTLSTKFGGRPVPFNPKDKDQLYFSFDRSLKLLKRDTIDILFIHEPDRPGQYDWYESWDTFYGPVCDVLEDLKKRGLIRYTGLGGTTVYEMTRIVEKSNYDVLLTAFNYSLLFREAEITLIPAAKKKDMGIVAGSPLQQGWFARRYDDVLSDPPAWLSPMRREQLAALYALVDRVGMSVPELAMRFVFSNPDIHTVLSGVRSAVEVDANVKTVEAGALPASILSELDTIYRMLPYRPCEEPLAARIVNAKAYRGPGTLR